MLRLFLSSAPADGSLQAITDAATSIGQWILTWLATLVTFIVSNPVVLFGFILAIISFAVGIFFRIWGSTGVL